jgi:hypothetical protein
LVADSRVILAIGLLRHGFIEPYNLEVEELHTFFVGGEVSSALVHNGQGNYIKKPLPFDAQGNPIPHGFTDVGVHGPGRKIAFGIEDHLNDFARANGAESWKQFAKADPMQWKSHFLYAMNDPNAEVLFNLKGVDVWGGVTRASRGAGGATDWELLQIMQNEGWWSRIKWMRDGVQVTNPFE